MTKKERGLKKNVIFLLIIILFCLLGLEGVSRSLVAAKNNLSFWHSKKEAIYPMLHKKFISYSPNDTNVLLLGGSALWYVGNRERNENFSDKHYFNVAFSGHSSLDSLHKYKYLISQGYKFDYVVFYHGINEVKFNNIPKSLYLDNYDHVLFYRLANSVFKHENPFLSTFLQSSLGFRLYQYYIQLKYIHKSIPAGGITKKWILFGKDIQTSLTFKNNLSKIMQLAKSENATLITPQFAFHVPQNYSNELFSDHSLGYQRNHHKKSNCCAIEIWGEPSNVVKGIETHNEIISRLQDNFVYVDTSNMSADINNFYDICHFSRKGEKKFSELVFNHLKENG